MKLGKKRSPAKLDYDQESLPSGIGEDHWGEVPKYQHYKYIEDLRKQKDAMIAKKNMIASNDDFTFIIAWSNRELRRSFFNHLHNPVTIHSDVASISTATCI